MAYGYQNTALPISPPQGPQPQGVGGGAMEQQQQQILQMLAKQASDPMKRRQMAEALARQLPPPPDNLFGGMRLPGGRHQGQPQQQQQGSGIPNFSGLGALMQPQGQAMMTPPAGMFSAGGNGQAAITAIPTNGAAAMAPTQGVPGFPLVPR